MVKSSINRFFIIPRREIAYINFILESYEVIGFVTTIDRFKAIIKITISPYFIEDFEKLIEDLKKEFPIEEIEYGL